MWTLKLSELWCYLWLIFVNQMKSVHWCWMQAQIRECEKKVNWQIDLKYFYECYLKISDKLEDVKYWPYYRVKWLWSDENVQTSEWVNNESARSKERVCEKSEVTEEFEIWLWMLCEILKVIGKHDILTVELVIWLYEWKSKTSDR
jgi:hypothetical protein